MYALLSNVNLASVLSEPEGLAIINERMYIMNVSGDVYRMKFD